MVALPTPIRQPGQTVQRVARAEPGSRNRCIRGQRRGLSHGDRPDGTSRAVSQTRRTPSVEKRASLRPRHGACIAGSASNRAVQFENPGAVRGSPVVARTRRPCLRATTTALRWLGRATAIGDYSMEVLSRRHATQVPPRSCAPRDQGTRSGDGSAACRRRAAPPRTAARCAGAFLGPTRPRACTRSPKRLYGFERARCTLRSLAQDVQVWGVGAVAKHPPPGRRCARFRAATGRVWAVDWTSGERGSRESLRNDGLNAYTRARLDTAQNFLVCPPLNRATARRTQAASARLVAVSAPTRIARPRRADRYPV